MFREPLPPRSIQSATKYLQGESAYSSSTFRRPNGRKNNEIRDMFLKLGEVNTSDGHCFYSLGNTKVLCSICGPKPDSRGSFSEIARVRLKVTTLKQKLHENMYDERDSEIEGLLTEVVNHIIFLEKYKGCIIYIRCTIIRGDGGELSAVLTSISLALIKAGIETRDIISALSVCSLRCRKTNRTYNLVDLDEAELTYYKEKYEVNLITLGICYNGKTVCFFNGSCSSISNKSFAEILNFAEGACRALGDMLKKSIQEYMVKKYLPMSNMKESNKNMCQQRKQREKITNYQKKSMSINETTGSMETTNEFKREDTETEEENI